jgi:predicted ATPase
MVARVTSLQLTSFKSFENATLPLEPFTLLVGRNSSGKSNAIDGLWVLSRLVGGLDIREALDGGREGPEIRGGVAGCSPPGASNFTLGCTVQSTSGIELKYSVTLQADPVVQVVHERLWTKRQSGNRRGQDRDLLLTDPADLDRSDIVIRWDNQSRGMNPPVDFRASQLALTQVATRIPATSAAGREIHALAADVVAALRAVFVLDPVPHQMRQYVRRKDSLLRRTADNLSATIAEIIADRDLHGQVLDLVRGLSESKVLEIGTAESRLDDVMLTLEEEFGQSKWLVPARQMSDGTLRFLALVAALFQSPDTGEKRSEPDPAAQTTLVVEEIENGLHPSQAARIIALLRAEAAERDVQILATTHSPALLDALPGAVHRAVIVSWRSQDGVSRLSRLPELSGYFDVVTSGSLGSAAVNDSLRSTDRQPVDAQSALHQLFSVS